VTTASARARRRAQLAFADLDPDRLARPALAVAVVAAGLLIYHLTRGSSFSPDDWIWINTRRGDGVGTFLSPYNGHLSLVPIAIYRLMFALVGIGSFAPYRVLLVIVASAVGVVLFEYSRHRIGEFCAFLVATLLLFLGPGWNDIMQPFQIAWLIAVGAGVLALSLLDRRRTAFDAAACVLITISLASTSVGVALAVGIAVDIALSRRRWRDAWIVGLPLALYVVWAVHYHSSEIQFSAVTNAPIDLAQTTTAALAGLVGLSGVTPTDVTGLSLAFGVPLFALAAAVVIVRSAAGWNHTRWLSLVAALVTFSLMTTLVRSFQSPFSSRYMYVTCVLVALIGVELVAGVTVSRRSQAVLGVLTLVAVISNIAVLRSGGGYFRQAGAQTDATLGAVALDRASVSAQTPLTQLPLYPITVVTAGQYFTAVDALGTPAYSVGQLLHASPAAQASADAQLVSDGDVKLTSASPGARSGPALAAPSAAPAVQSAVGGTVVRTSACVRLVGAATSASGAPSSITVRAAPGALSIVTGQAPATVAVRRFAPTFTALGTVQAGGAAVVTVRGGAAPRLWQLRLQTVTGARICTVGAR
jgi:hypothetical protein